jgi:hypothetical protein
MLVSLSSPNPAVLVGFDGTLTTLLPPPIGAAITSARPPEDFPLELLEVLTPASRVGLLPTGIPEALEEEPLLR